jgi:ferredoxin
MIIDRENYYNKRIPFIRRFIEIRKLIRMITVTIWQSKCKEKFFRKIELMNRFPTIDLGRCTECKGCIEIAPEVFRYNTSTGMMEVIELAYYPEDLVDEAIKNCPEDCISWESGVGR